MYFKSSLLGTMSITLAVIFSMYWVGMGSLHLMLSKNLLDKKFQLIPVVQMTQCRAVVCGAESLRSPFFDRMFPETSACMLCGEKQPIRHDMSLFKAFKVIFGVQMMQFRAVFPTQVLRDFSMHLTGGGGGG